MIGTGLSVRAADAAIARQPVVADRWQYQWGVLLTGMEHVWRATGERRYFDHVRRSVDRFVDPRGAIATYAMSEYNLDHVRPGTLLFALLRETGDPRYRGAIELLRDQLRTQPRTASGGFWHKRIYPHQMWLDGIYMACPFYAEYARTFGDGEAVDDIVHQVTLIFERTRDDRTGLLHHAWDESRTQAWADPHTGRSPSFWARAIGWFAMALADLLELVPAGRGRDTLASILDATMAAVVPFADAATGLWFQVLDQGPRAGNYLEASASCMFAYALAKGARLGALPAERGAVARRAYGAIVERFVRADGARVDLEGTCGGAGVGLAPDGRSYRDGSFEYYLSEPIVTNDHKGVGAFLLASVELERAGEPIGG